MNKISMLAAAAIAGCASAQVVIDNFDNVNLFGSGMMPTDDLPGTLTMTSTIVEDVLGFADFNARIISTAVLPGPFGGRGAFAFSTGTLVTGTTTLDYSFASTSFADPIDGINLTFFRVDLPFTLRMELTDADGREISRNLRISPSLGGTVAGATFATFAGDAGFDFSSVTGFSVQFNIAGESDVDFVLTEIAAVDNAVPTPGAVALLGLAGCTFMIRRRTR